MDRILVCGAKAELIDVTIDSVSIACPRCGEYAVSSGDIASGQIDRATLDISFSIMAAMSGTRRTVSTFGNLRARVDAAVEGHFLDYLSLQLECCNSGTTLALRPTCREADRRLVAGREAVSTENPG